MSALPPARNARIRSLVAAAEGAERSARFEEARARYEEALHALDASASNPGLASGLLRRVGRTLATQGDADAALDCYEAALASAEASGAVGQAAHAVNCQANVAFQRAALEEAAELYAKARRMAVRAGDSRLAAMIDQNLGNVANVYGDFSEAQRRYRSSLDGYRRERLIDYVGPALNNLGRLHTDLEEWADAEACFREARDACRAVGDRPSEVLVEVNRARMWIAREEWERARIACEAADELAARLGDERWRGDIELYQGIVLRARRRRGLAERAFQRALRIARRWEDMLLEAEVLREMADLYRAQERNREMFECLNRAHRLLARLRTTPLLADVERRIRALEESFLQIVRTWGESIESKDRYTQGHCERVAHYATSLARAVGFETDLLVWFRMGALLHDVGKIGVPSEILNKRGPLTEDEWAFMRRHPDLGVELLGDVEFPWDIRPMVRHHHERWDGSGYPDGLAGRAIPRAARILCIADVFDALTSARSYRPALTVDAALELMRAERGQGLDPALFDRFAGIVPGLVELRSAHTGPQIQWPDPLVAPRRARRAPRYPPLGSVA